MMAVLSNKAVKAILSWFVLPVAVVGLVYVIVTSIMQPVNFNKATAQREEVAIQRLKDIRELQVAFKSTYNRYAPTMDSLKWFYEEGEILVKLQVGSKDDSLAYAHTKAIKKKYPWLRGEVMNKKLFELYQAGDSLLVFSVDNKIPVRDTIFNSRQDFVIDSLLYIPFSQGTPVELETTIKTVSGVKVPLFEARMPYRELLKGLDNQLRINLDADCEAKNRYEGLQVGSISAPNNNAGNWE